MCTLDECVDGGAAVDKGGGVMIRGVEAEAIVVGPAGQRTY